MPLLYNSAMPVELTALKPLAKQILLFVTIVSVLLAAYMQFRGEFFGPNHDAITARVFAPDDYDIPPLLLRVRECTNLLQTRSYWHEDYTPLVPFYRPLALTWFWLEYHAFGSDYYNRWVAVSIFLQLLFCTLFALFIKNLTNSMTAALLTLIAFAGYRFNFAVPIFEFFKLSADVPAYVAVYLWKDQPTLLSDSSVVAALILAQREKWAGALLFAVISVLFKESGWMTYTLVFLMLATTGQLRRMPRWVYLAAAGCIALTMAVRFASGLGVVGGYHVGQNYGWKMRYTGAVCGIFFEAALHGYWPATLLGISVYTVAVRIRCRAFIRIMALLVVVAICSMAEAYNLQTDWVVGLAALCDLKASVSVEVLGFLFAGCVSWVIDTPTFWRPTLLLIVFSFIAAASYASAMQVNIHVLNLCYAIQAAVLGIALTAGIRIASAHFMTAKQPLAPQC